MRGPPVPGVASMIIASYHDFGLVRWGDLPGLSHTNPWYHEFG
jgi:hypothetical protein